MLSINRKLEVSKKIVRFKFDQIYNVHVISKPILVQKLLIEILQKQQQVRQKNIWDSIKVLKHLFYLCPHFSNNYHYFLTIHQFHS